MMYKSTRIAFKSSIRLQSVFPTFKPTPFLQGSGKNDEQTDSVCWRETIQKVSFAEN